MNRIISLLFIIFACTAVHAEQTNSGSIDSLWITNGSRRIYGELFTPQGNVRGICIIAHGFNGTHHYGRNYHEPLASMGYQCYAFDFPCGSINSKSDNNTMNMSVLDEKSDVMAIIEYFRTNPEYSGKEIVLIGESQGGLVSALTAAEMKDKVSKLVLVYPALCIPDNWRERYPEVKQIPEVTEIWGVKLGRRFFEEIRTMRPLSVISEYTGPVLIVQGDKDRIVSATDSQRAAELYKNAQLHIIKGAGHGFKPEEFQEEAEQLKSFLK